MSLFEKTEIVGFFLSLSPTKEIRTVSQIFLYLIDIGADGFIYSGVILCIFVFLSEGFDVGFCLLKCQSKTPNSSDNAKAT